MNYILIIYEIIYFIFYRLIKKISNYLDRIYFLFEKKKIQIPLSKIFNLSSISISNLRKVNNQVYENDVLNYLTEKAKNKDLFFDIGAHYGFYTINLQKYFKSIYAFEANPSNYEILKHNISKHNFNNVKIINSFVGKKNEKIDFLMSYNTYLSQIDKESFLSHELMEFCNDGFIYSKKKELEEIYDYCYSNLINGKFFFNFLFIFKNLFFNLRIINKEDLKKKFLIIRRYNRYYERYICKKIEIKSKSIDQIYSENYNNVLIKIDVEGSEVNVINGMDSFIKKFKPDIFCEIGHDHDKIIGLITNYGYNFHKIDWKSFYFTKI